MLVLKSIFPLCGLNKTTLNFNAVQIQQSIQKYENSGHHIQHCHPIISKIHFIICYYAILQKHLNSSESE